MPFAEAPHALSKLEVAMSSLAFIGTLLIAGGVFYAKREHRIISGSEITIGQVVNLVENKRSTRRRRRITYTPEIRFVDNSRKEVLFRSRFSSNRPGLKVGDSVDIAYRRDNSSDARILKFTYTFLPSLIAIALGVAFIMVGVGTIVGEKWMEKTYMRGANQIAGLTNQ